MKNETDKTRPKDDGKRLPKKATRSHLENAALYYVERFSSTADSLQKMLARRVLKSNHYHDTDVDEGMVWVADIVERYQKSGLIDDRSFAEARARTLHQRGNSAKVIRMKLMSKGVSAELIDHSLKLIDEASGEPGSSELGAAQRLAKRRRLGPFAEPSKRAERRDKDMAALARAGFSYDIASKVIDGES